MSKRHSANDKRPVPHALAPREHYVKKYGSWKPKMAFENEASADNYINARSFFLRNGYVSYICRICNKWHIGKLNDKQE